MLRLYPKLAGYFLIWVLSTSAAAGSDWPLFNHDAARTGSSPDRLLTVANVGRLALRWDIQLGEAADSAPIAVGNRLFLTAKDGTTYAVETNHGRILWRFHTHGPNITTSVPAFDANSRTLYVPGVDGFIHKLDPASGRELRDRGFPVRITTEPSTEKEASSLNVANGYLYAQTSGYFGDAAPYVGHVVAIRLSDGHSKVFNTLCSSRHQLIDPQTCAQQRSGMWSRAGVVVDPDPSMQGRIYVATGNGPFDESGGAYGDSVLSLSADARLLDHFTPENFAELENGDIDLGSSSPALLPRQPSSATPLLAVQGGKDGQLRLLDRTKLGGVGHALQTIDLGYKIFCAPAVWVDSEGTVWVFVDLEDGVHAFKLLVAHGKTRLVSAWVADVAEANEGTSPALSNGIVFVATSGVLLALDAQSGRTLWNHSIGQIHWESPIVVNGTVYCADEDGHLSAFSLPAGGR